jgi:hypothetical protein
MWDQMEKKHKPYHTTDGREREVQNRKRKAQDEMLCQSKKLLFTLGCSLCNSVGT